MFRKQRNWAMAAVQQLPFLALFVLVLGCAKVGMAEFKEGQHYFKVENPQTETGKTISVVEFFNYACPHCNDLEPHITKWLDDSKPDYVKFEHMPAYWNDLFENTAKAFYTAEALDLQESMHTVLFDAIHKKRVNFADIKAIRSVFTAQGVDTKDFDKQFNSFYVNQKASAANKLFASYKLRSVPTIVVNSQWKTSVQDAGSTEDLLKVIDFLVEKAKQDRQL